MYSTFPSFLETGFTYIISVCLNSYFKAVLKIYPSKPPRFDLKRCQRHRNGLSVYRLTLVCPSKIKRLNS